MSSGENERLAGRYRVVRRLGRGGMGVVWRAVDEVLGREVAVKELRAYNDASGPELADLRLRMRREARAAARVRHPGVIAVHDVTDHEGRPVIVMELVDGPSLDDVLNERGVVEPAEAARIGAAVLEALAAAHEAGVLHRDVKPGNVLLDRSGRVVLTDFGIAAMDDPGDGSATHLTRSGEIVGSLDYLAPERAQGQQPGPPSDVWALGATLYAAVEGASPFRRTSTWSTLNAIVVEPLPEPRRAGPLEPVLRQLLDKDPARRPDARSAARLLDALARAQGGGPVPAGPATSSAPPSGPVPTEPNAVPHRPPGFGPAPAHSGTSGTQLPATAGVSAAEGGHAEGLGPAAARAGGLATEAGRGAGSGAAPGRAGGFGEEERNAAGFATVPGRPGGFGPVASPAAATANGPGGAFPSAGHAPAGRPAGSAAARREPGRNRSGALIAAAVAAVLLAGGGVTYALVGQGAGTKQERSAGEQPSPRGPGASPGRVLDPGGAPSADPSAQPSRAGTTKSARPSSPGTSKAPLPGSGGGTDGGTTNGGGASGGGGTSGGAGTTGGGGQAAQPAPACHSRGGGTYDCQVWRTSTSYSHAGAETGVLNAGTNYFYCQADLGRRETHGQWTNVWWARTDDDSGNTGVYVNVVNIKGGDNDGPVPGLPVC
ncbi:protein kinase [Streptomyces sp. NPDC053755]|uniref:serine/threonine-protein kinase n=1 Tax=Streptomyces sp. NPDC053755 TaxID=3155815 RepID=UPI003448687F